MSKFVTLMIAWLIMSMIMQHLIDNGAIYQATGITAGSSDAIQLQSGIWDAMLLGFPGLWILSQFVTWWD